MRTKKFRGYSQTFNSWLYGDLLSIRQAETIVCEESGHEYEVDPNSVGQLTGLHDKNGKEIYEGDILDSSEKIPMIFEVYFKNGGFRYGTKDRSVDISFSNLSNNWLDRILKRFHVIGNIYENPELISKTPTHEH